MESMITDDPISVWIDELRNEDAAAARKLWHHYVERLIEAAQRRLHPATRSVYDEEDAVQSAFQSFYAGLIEGRFPDLQDRNDLWRLLLVITARKISGRHRADLRQCRDSRRKTAGSWFIDRTEGGVSSALVSREPTPEFAAEFADVCEMFMQSLGDSELQRVATLRMEGYTDGEIGERLGCSRSTVQRRLEIIRRSGLRLTESCGE